MPNASPTSPSLISSPPGNAPVRIWSLTYSSARSFAAGRLPRAALFATRASASIPVVYQRCRSGHLPRNPPGAPLGGPTGEVSGLGVKHPEVESSKIQVVSI